MLTEGDLLVNELAAVDSSLRWEIELWAKMLAALVAAVAIPAGWLISRLGTSDGLTRHNTIFALLSIVMLESMGVVAGFVGVSSVTSQIQYKDRVRERLCGVIGVGGMPAVARASAIARLAPYLFVSLDVVVALLLFRAGANLWRGDFGGVAFPWTTWAAFGLCSVVSVAAVELQRRIYGKLKEVLVSV